MEDTDKKITDVSKLKQSLTDLKEILSDTDFRLKIAQKRGKDQELQTTNELLLATEFAETALAALDKDQQLEFPTAELSQLPPTAADIKTLPLGELLDQLPATVQKIEKSLPKTNEDFEHWQNQLASIGESAIAELSQIIIYNQKLKEDLKLLLDGLGEISSDQEKPATEALSKLEEKFNLMVQDFADFDCLVQDLTDNLTKFVNSNDFIINNFFDIFDLLLKLKNRFLAPEIGNNQS